MDLAIHDLHGSSAGSKGAFGTAGCRSEPLGQGRYWAELPVAGDSLCRLSSLHPHSPEPALRSYTNVCMAQNPATSFQAQHVNTRAHSHGWHHTVTDAALHTHAARLHSTHPNAEGSHAARHPGVVRRAPLPRPPNHLGVHQMGGGAELSPASTKCIRCIIPAMGGVPPGCTAVRCTALPDMHCCPRAAKAPLCSARAQAASSVRTCTITQQPTPPWKCSSHPLRAYELSKKWRQCLHRFETGMGSSPGAFHPTVGRCAVVDGQEGGVRGEATLPLPRHH